MTLIVGEGTNTLRASRIPVDVAVELIGQLPADISIRVRADYADQLAALERQAAEPGYFGLAVALARETWRS